MATLTIRNLSEETRRALKARAAAHDRSMEAEVREILDDAVGVRVDFVHGWLSDVEQLDIDLSLPERGRPRSVDLL
ncbi:FitA-like ribbon-helix-helix domain-containing protein [Agrococcus beijingensis]|uniref:FitA-like ribbon-helix-helix domain-containing protein n=1 Tax=Agrococcus beijingensis TaxID=3068634 RepID=UPI0027424228|nr:toxin-antitoxin system antitoxin subunit [Agrococcus sp. REN33]